MIVFGVLNGSIYNETIKATENEIYFKIDLEENPDVYSANDKVKSVLDEVTLDQAGEKVLGDEQYSKYPLLEEYSVVEFNSASGVYERHHYASVIVELYVDYDSDV